MVPSFLLCTYRVWYLCAFLPLLPASSALCGLRTGLSPVRGVFRCYLPVCLSVICELPTYQAINPTYLPVSFVYSLSCIRFRVFAFLSSLFSIFCDLSVYFCSRRMQVCLGTKYALYGASTCVVAYSLAYCSWCIQVCCDHYAFFSVYSLM